MFPEFLMHPQAIFHGRHGAAGWVGINIWAFGVLELFASEDEELLADGGRLCISMVLECNLNCMMICVLVDIELGEHI